MFSWNIGFSNTNLESHLRFGKLPIGYLFDNEGNLLIFNTTPQKIENFSYQTGQNWLKMAKNFFHYKQLNTTNRDTISL